MSHGTGDREALLGRVDEALQVLAPRHHETMTKPVASNVTTPFREWLPPVGESPANRIENFARLSEMLKTEFHRCATLAAAAEQIATLATEGSWKTIAFHRGQLTEALVPLLPTTVGTLLIEPGYDREALEACDAGLTECESLVSQTGSACITSLSSGGRTLSVLPPHHIIVAREEQLVADLSAAYERLALKYEGRYPSFIGFVTGPSRTGDIERILVLGAHGPKRLTILLIP
jgi:L-lactate dehydrogenase complex protein LldG